MRLLVAAGAIGLGLVMPALAVELFVGRSAAADVCTGRGVHACDRVLSRRYEALLVRRLLRIAEI